MELEEVKKLDAYLKRLFSNPRLRIAPRPGKEEVAEIYNRDELIGMLTVDDEDDERSYNFRMDIALTQPNEDVDRLNAFLRNKLGSEKIRVVPRAKKRDSLEAYVGDEFVGVLFIDDKRHDRSCVFEMAILDVDLEPAGEASP